ncbi:inner membrane protein YpjD [Alkalilimnicola sp. S0819]|uniref:cytochrome C assembly family protein n=1 Tax=Alkalilimnicola sp. S0819 TaxID=2613922 RepID=UPI0012629CD7|nr:cytochrome c biogenesis protein CcsA [Alkalilimnicola sp. S0819]KAB7622568.1 phosphohydrolase [Alkalilimnicola sp. S0819]MPQ17455.1 phosphohydrolase [Alkalilimnicola sp. S0819]
MPHVLISIIVLNLYLASGSGLAWFVARRGPRARAISLGLGLAAVLGHLTVAYLLASQGEGLRLGFFDAASLVAAIMAAVVLLTALRAPSENLGIFVMPLAALTLLASLLPGGGAGRPIADGLAAHVLCSVLAYGVLAIAALQALMLAWQEHRLRHKHPGGLARLLPPLQVMEQLLFQLLHLGFVLLSLSLLTGFVFLEDMFAQHVAHKTVLSIVAWLLFGILLWGRRRFGWRGRLAARWTIGGFIALMLAYFGSKLVLQYLLGH